MKPLQFLLCLLTALLGVDAQWTDATKSVIAGEDTYFAPLLPNTLKARHEVPDATHSNLRFWFSPDSFEQDNTADATPVAVWRNVAGIGIVGTSQTLGPEPKAVERLLQPTNSKRPLYRRNVVNGQGAVQFARGSTDGSSGQSLEMFLNSSTTQTGFVENPFSGNEFTMMLVAKTTQAAGDEGSMGIIRAGESSSSTPGEKGFQLYKSTSSCIAGGGSAPTCAQGKYARLSTLAASYGASADVLSGGETDVNDCEDLCTNGCNLNNLPSACRDRVGPTNAQFVQDPDKGFRVITIKAEEVSSGRLELSVFIDGFHSSSQPPIYISGNNLSNTYASGDPGVIPPSILELALGFTFNNRSTGGLGAQYMSGYIAELMVYDAALTQSETDRLGHYLATKYAVSSFRLNDQAGGASRTVALSCSNCAGPGPIGEGGETADGGVAADGCSEARGAVEAVWSAFSVRLNTTVAGTSLSSAYVGMRLTVCAGACVADRSSGQIANARGSAAVSGSDREGNMTELVNVSLAAALGGVSAGDGFVLNNAHMVKLPPETTAASIAGHAVDDFYSFRGHWIYFRGAGRCAGRVASVVSYDAASKCAILGSESEAGDYLASSAVAPGDIAADGACRGSNCEGPQDVGGMGGAAAGHVSSVKILGGATAGCSTGMSLSAAGGGGSGFEAAITASAGGAIESIAISSHGSGYTSAPSLVVSDAACTCAGGAWATGGTAANGLACVAPKLGKWADGQDGCVPGGGGQPYLIVKDRAYTSVVKSGYYAGTNVVSGQPYQAGPAEGGTMVVVRGAYLLPNDMHAAAAASATNVQQMDGNDAARALKHLSLTLGGKHATACALYNHPRGSDPAARSSESAPPSTPYSPVSDLPELRCKAPPGVGSGLDLVLKWHGVPLTINSWWKYSPPAVRSITPSQVPYTGGTYITITGANFGPADVWGGAATAGRGSIHIVDRGWRPCEDVAMLSATQLTCRVPALRPLPRNLDKTARLVSVTVLVSAGGQQSEQSRPSKLSYSGTPSYYSCTLDRSTCFSCCRSACVVESFADSIVHGTYRTCDQRCYQYCQYTSSARRLLLGVSETRKQGAKRRSGKRGKSNRRMGGRDRAMKRRVQDRRVRRRRLVAKVNQ